jgi:MSHA biogenesis protein MshN
MGDRKVMSLINKMLQDLDARGTPGAESFPSQIRPVARERASLGDRFDSRSAAMAFAGVAVCAFGAALWFGWSHYRHAQAPARPAAVAAAPAKAAAPSPAPAPAAMQASQGMTGTITMGPANAAASAPPAAPLPVPAPVAAAAARAARQAIMAELQARMSASSKPAAIAHASTRAEKRKALAEAREAKSARHAKAGADKLAASAAVKGKRGAQGVQGMQGMENPAPQRAEGEYRHALTALQDGRMTEALAALEQALKIDPSHDAARQTLVGLLIEARRSDDAIRHLQAGLALDVRQPSLAMLLARLQIERGGSGIDTLMRTLPYAGSNADYHAFLAGALQREQRHREAAEQYQAALRAAPANGVWWMGLGMSLQAEKRNAEALDAFQRARISGMLSVELQAFVERRLQMLAR